MHNEPSCKKCRRAGIKLFLKGVRCNGPKCAMVKKAYPPGEKAKRKGKISEYGRELREKQKLRHWYNVNEGQFEKYVKNAMKKQGGEQDSGDILVKSLESRFDNTVYRFGFAESRSKARQMVKHGLILLNGNKVNIPSYPVKEGDVISINPQKKNKIIFENLNEKLKLNQTPTWLHFNAEKLEGKIIGSPVVNEIEPPVKLTSIFEFYSR